MKDNIPNMIPDDRLSELFGSLTDAPLPAGIDGRIMEAVRIRQAGIEEKRKEHKWLLLTVSLAAVIITAGVFVIFKLCPDLKFASFDLPEVELPHWGMADLVSVLVSYLPFGIALSLVFLFDGYIRRRFYKRRSRQEHHPATGN